MAENAAKKVKSKTVNRTGKALVKKALVISKAKQKQVANAEQIKKLNEEVKAKKQALESKNKTEETNETASVSAKADNLGVSKEKKYCLTIGARELLAAGCHLGHKVSKTNPKAKENIYAARDGIQIFDLMKTKSALEEACNFLHNAARSGKKIALLGTKRQAREVVKRVATENNLPYITDRWLGGTISNWEQIRKNIKKLMDLREGKEKGTLKATKKEMILINKEIIRLEKIVGGLTKLGNELFDILVVVDGGLEKTANREAKMRGVTTVAICDTDCDPTKFNYAIPANDDNVKSISLLIEEIGRAIKAAGVNNKK